MTKQEVKRAMNRLTYHHFTDVEAHLQLNKEWNVSAVEPDFGMGVSFSTLGEVLEFIYQR